MIEIATLTIPPIIQIKMLAYNTLTALVKALKQPVEMVAAISHVLSPLKKYIKWLKVSEHCAFFRHNFLNPRCLCSKLNISRQRCAHRCVCIAVRCRRIQALRLLTARSPFSPSRCCGAAAFLVALLPCLLSSPPPPTLHYRHHRKNIEGSLPAYTSYAARLAPTRANGRAR